MLAYLTLSQAIDIHAKTVDISGGGTKGQFDMGRLESVLLHIQNDDYYPTFADKLINLFFFTCKFHCFEDGNKRIAIALSAQFLLLNGYVFLVPEFIRDMENISYHVAAGSIDRELLGEIIKALIHGDEEEESLKLKIISAITNAEYAKDYSTQNAPGDEAARA